MAKRKEGTLPPRAMVVRDAIWQLGLLGAAIRSTVHGLEIREEEYVSLIAMGRRVEELSNAAHAALTDVDHELEPLRETVDG